MDETYLCDLDTCEPKGAVAVDAAPGRWQAMYYEACTTPARCRFPRQETNGGR